MMSSDTSTLPDRARFLGASAVYFGTFVWSYRTFAHPYFGYYGLGWEAGLPADCWLLIVTLAFVPACWLPIRIERPANFLLLILYFVVYVPSLMLAFHADRPGLPRPTAVVLVLSLFTGLSLIQLAQRTLPAVALPRLQVHPWLFWGLFSVFGAICFVYVAVTLGANASLISLAEVYALRREAAETIVATGSRFGVYAFSWLNSFFLPLLYAWGWYRRRWHLCVLSIGVYLFLFSVWGGKASLFAPVALVGLTLLLRLPLRHFPAMMALVFAGLLASPALVQGDSTLEKLFQSWLVYLIHMRTFCSSALLITQYLHFKIRVFSTHIFFVFWRNKKKQRKKEE